jgi:hypothetical protein
MKKRVYFKSIKIRNLFFEKVLNTFKFDKWNQIVLNFNIPRIMLSNYRNGTLTIPEDVYKNFIKNFNDKDKNYFQNNISYYDENWGRILGGKSTYIKYNDIFEKGRKKAIQKIKESSIKFDINLLLTKELSYFIGLFIGDGFANKYGYHYIVQFTGDKRKELDFYSKIISRITFELFHLSPIIRADRFSNTLRVNFFSVNLFNLIIERFKIKSGRKSKEVLIPEEILNSSPEVLLACIAGIYDAEGSFYFDKRKNYKTLYPVICLHMNNPLLIKQISDIFMKNNIKHSFTSNYSTLYIYGKKSINNFLSKIKLLNPKYIPRIELLKNI